jgi:hypothetical protein
MKLGIVKLWSGYGREAGLRLDVRDATGEDRGGRGRRSETDGDGSEHRRPGDSSGRPGVSSGRPGDSAFPETGFRIPLRIRVELLEGLLRVSWMIRGTLIG